MTAENVNGIDWQQLLSFIGVSAIVSGLISTVVNYTLTLREFRKERRIEVVKEKLAVYSALIYHIDKMKLKGDVLKAFKNDPSTEDIYAFSTTELPEIHKAIDHIFETKFYLLNHDILAEWSWVKTLYAQPPAKEHLPKLRHLLVTEYNKTVALFRDVVGSKWAEKHGVVKEIA